MNLRVEPFSISVFANNRPYTLRVVQLSISTQVEIFEVSGGKTAKRIVSWRPLERAKGNSSMNFDMHAEAGQEINDKSLQALEDTILAIRRHIRRMEQPSVSQMEWIKQQKNYLQPGE